MLILTRQASESIRIGGDVLVTVVAIYTRHPKTGEPLSVPRVELGIKAPDSMEIVRSEIDKRRA